MATTVTILHSWRMKDQRTGRWRLLRFKLADQDAKAWADKEGVELQKVEGSAERRLGTKDEAGYGVCTLSPEELQRKRRPQSEVLRDALDDSRILVSAWNFRLQTCAFSVDGRFGRLFDRSQAR